MPDDRFVADMNLVARKLTFGETIAKMAEFDFSPIVRYLQREDKNHWTEEKAISELENFKQFFALRSVANFPIIPLKEDIDEVWHACILHTKFYIRLCKSLYGKYVHHSPSDGTEEGRQKNKTGFQKTTALFKEVTGQSYAELTKKVADCDDCSSCCIDCTGCGSCSN